MGDGVAAAVAVTGAETVAEGVTCAETVAVAVSEALTDAVGDHVGVTVDDCVTWPQHVTAAPAESTHDHESPALTPTRPAPGVATAVGTRDTC